MQAKNKEVEALTDEVRAVLGHVVGRTSPRLHIGVPLTVCVAVCVCVCVCVAVCVWCRPQLRALFTKVKEAEAAQQARGE